MKMKIGVRVEDYLFWSRISGNVLFDKSENIVCFFAAFLKSWNRYYHFQFINLNLVFDYECIQL